jgi:hypothetical protein
MAQMRVQVRFYTLLFILIIFLSHQTIPKFYIKILNKASNRNFFILLLSFFILSLELSTQEITGEIEGRIIDKNSSAVPGVLINVSSPGLQGTRSTESNSDGLYRFILLPPGFYTLKFSHISYKPVTIDNIQLRLGKTSSIGDLMMIDKPYELEEILIRDSRNLIDPNSTVVGGNFTKNEIEALPLQRDYQFIPLLLPQINTSYYGDKFSSAGATGIENRYLIDGIEVTDPIWFSRGISLPYNFVKDIEVLRGGYEAQYRSALGNIINVITPPGGDKISGQVFGFYTGSRFTANSNSIPGEEPSEGDFSLYDFGLSIGGPLIKETLWLNMAYNPNFQNEEMMIPGVGNRDDKIISHQTAGKLSWHLSNKTQLIFNFTGDFYYQDKVWISVPSGIDTYLNPDPALIDFKWTQYSPSMRAVHSFSDKFFIEGSFSKYQTNYSQQPATEIGKEPSFYNYEDGTVSGGLDNSYDIIAVRYNISLKSTLLLNDHIIKGGIEYLDNSYNTKRLFHTVEKFSDSLYNFYLVDVDGTVGNKIPSIFIQDEWRINDSWQINAGLRWDGQYIIGSDGKVAQKIIGQYQPRLGIIFTPDRNNEQKIFASYSRFYQELSQYGLPYYYLKDVETSYNSYNHDPRKDPTGADTLWMLSGQIQEEISGFRGQYTDEFCLGYERLILNDYKFSVQGIYRMLGEGIEDALSGARQKFVLGNPGRSPLSEYPELTRDYMAFEIVFQKVSNDPFNFSVSYVLSRTYGNYQGLFETESGIPGANVTGAFEYPETTIDATGLLPYDRNHAFKFYSSYRFDFGLSMGIFFLWMSGTPLNEFGTGSLGWGRIFLQPRGTAGRTSSIWDLNFRLAYTLPQLISFDYQARFILDLFHIASQQEAVNYDQLHYLNVDEYGNQSDPNPTYGLPTSFQPPMSLRFGLEVNF